MASLVEEAACLLNHGGLLIKRAAGTIKATPREGIELEIGLELWCVQVWIVYSNKFKV